MWCKRLEYIINKRLLKQNSRIFFSPNKKKRIINLNNSKRIVQKKINRKTKKMTKLQDNLNNLQKKMRDISASTLQQIIKDSNIPTSQTDIINEIFEAARFKNSKSRRYSENWMLTCLLFQIRYTLIINK